MFPFLLVPGKRKGPEDFSPGPFWLVLVQYMKKPGVLCSPPSASGLECFVMLGSDLYAGWTVEKRNRTKKKRRKK
jgi:hypothetical protein